MATQPTNNAVPSESPRDLKFNAGKIDEFVTSLAKQYLDRFGNSHYTIEGLRKIAQDAISAFGWITLDSFEEGASLTLPNQVLRYKSTGEYYRWDGDYPKTVPAGSTPANSGGVAKGAWVSIGDAALRNALINAAADQGDALISVKQPGASTTLRTQHDKNSDFYSVKDFGAKCDGTTDDTAAFQNAAASGLPVFIPAGSVSLSTYVDGLFWSYRPVTFTSAGHAPYSVIDKRNFAARFSNFKEKMRRGDAVAITCFGDSTTEGIGSTGWSGRPAGAPTAINPAGAYPSRLQSLLQDVHSNSKIKVNNAGAAGRQIQDGWAYANYKAYATDIYGVPDVCIIAFGLNDVHQTTYTAEIFRAQYEKLLYLIMKDSQVLPILMTPNSTIQSTQGHTALIKGAADVVRDVADKFGLPVIDQLYWQNEWLNSSTDPAAVWNTVQPDFIHFNDIGYMFMASVVVKEVSPIVVYNPDKYARFPAWSGKILNRKGAGFGQELDYFRPTNSAYGVTQVWKPVHAQANDNIVDIWVWNDKPQSAIRYHSINNDGWTPGQAAYAAWPLITIYAKSYSLDIVHVQETVAGCGQGVTADKAGSECSQLVGQGGFGRPAPFGLVRMVYTLRATPLDTGAFFGYFSISDHSPLAKESVTARTLSAGSGQNLMATIPMDVTNDQRIGYGVDGSTSRIRLNGLMPKGSGIVLLETAAYNAGDGSKTNLRQGMLLSRTPANRVSLRPVYWDSGTGLVTSFGVETLGATWTDFSSTDAYNFTVSLARSATVYTLNVNTNTNNSVVGTWATGVGNQIGSSGGYAGSIFQASDAPAASYAEHHIFIQ